MRVIYYWRSADSAVKAAYDADVMEAARIEALGEQFANQFGAQALFTKGFNSVFAGIMFTDQKPCPEPGLWTKGTSAMPLQVPLKELPRSRAHMQNELEALQKRFHGLWPKDIAAPRVSKLVSLVCPDGMLPMVPDPMLGYFHYGGVSYLFSSFPLVGLEEITASLFSAASDATTKEPESLTNG